MSDLVTSRIPRERLAGLLVDTSSDNDRITARIPVMQLEQLLGEGIEVPHDEPLEVPQESPAEILHVSITPVVVRFHRPSYSRTIVTLSFVVTLLVGALVLVLI